MKKLWIFCLAIIVWSSCEDRSAIKTMESETMVIHDEAMKDMAQMNGVARQLRAQIKTMDSSSVDYKTMLEASTAVKRAEDDMMEWMQQYDAPADDMPKDAALQYLTDQKAKIQKNHQDIKAASQQAKVLLK